MNDALNQAVRDATVEICQSALGGTVQSSPPVEASVNARPFETSVVTSFVGTLSGAFALRCSRKLAARVASQMLGMEIAVDSDDMKDAIGEFFNMVIGAAKTRFASEGEPFRISVPTTIVGADYVLHVKANESEKLAVLDFSYGGDALSIEVYLK